jgi:hypothetical protein
LNRTKGKERENKRIKINKNNKIGEKQEEGETKGHGYWPSPYHPISPYFFHFFHSQTDFG